MTKTEKSIYPTNCLQIERNYAQMWFIDFLLYIKHSLAYLYNY